MHVYLIEVTCSLRVRTSSCIVRGRGRTRPNEALSQSKLSTTYGNYINADGVQFS